MKEVATTKNPSMIVLMKKLCVTALGVALLTACAQNQRITSFEECVAAGNPVMESYPRQCRADGALFVEEITNEHSDLIQVKSPKKNQIITSPLVVAGNARGTWYFEASFPVRLLDGNGNELAVTPALAQAEWMTENFVPFVATLNFTSPSTATGLLILEKDNPSGLPEHALQVEIPVQF